MAEDRSKELPANAPKDHEEALAHFGDIGREVGKMAAALEATLLAFGTTAGQAFSTASAFNVAQLEVEQIFGPPDVLRVRILWTSRRVDADLLAYGSLALAALLYGGL